MGAVADDIKAKLTAALAPLRLDLIDDSSRHDGHAHAGVESHFNLTIEAAAFTGLGRLERQRLVMSVLADELAGPVHALSIRAVAPGEG
jgi:BolA family transcriptional regulator, general stress-responsive regulator